MHLVCTFAAAAACHFPGHDRSKTAQNAVALSQYMAACRGADSLSQGQGLLLSSCSLQLGIGKLTLPAGSSSELTADIAAKLLAPSSCVWVDPLSWRVALPDKGYAGSSIPLVSLSVVVQTDALSPLMGAVHVQVGCSP